MWTEEAVVSASAWAMIGTAMIVFGLLVAGRRAGYGRYEEPKIWVASIKMDAKLAWVVQESPMIFWAVWGYMNAKKECYSSRANLILWCFLLVHYLQRTFIFPLLMKGSKQTTVYVMLCALAYCTWNGHLQNTWLMRAHVYEDTWVYDPRFLLGISAAITGMGINLHSDHILRNLRKPGEKGYKIPRGGMFEYVSGANFFGEILEWTGFAVATWSLAGAAFAVFTFSNIGPRGHHHHQWYLEKFDDYPKNRRYVHLLFAHTEFGVTLLHDMYAMYAHTYATRA